MSGIDIYPTVLDIVGANLRSKNYKDGVFLLLLLEGDTIDERVIYWYSPHYSYQG